MAEVASAYVSLLPSAKGFGRQLDSQIGPQIDTAGRSGGKRFGGTFGAAFKGVLAGVGISTAIRSSVDFLKGSIAEAREAQKVGAQTAAVIKSTGGAAGLTAKQFGALATATSLKTGIDDEQIQAGENMLATFTNVRNAAGKNNDVFTQATKLAVDMGVALKTGPTNASMLLGKALNDPVKGVGRLTKAGVTFTDQQKKQIAQMVKVGDTAGAQKIILAEVAKEFGGSAEAQATAGDKMAVAWGNFKEQVGTALLPVIDKFATAMTDKVVPALSQMIAYLQKNPQILLAFGVAIAAIAAGFVVAFIAANALIIGIAALIAGVVYAYTKFPQFRAAVEATFNAIRAVVMAVLPFVIGFIKGQINVIVGIFRLVKAILTGDWKGAWDAIKQIVSGVWGSIKAVISGGWAAIKALFRLGASALKSLMKAAWDGVKSAVSTGISSAVTLVKALPGKIKSALGNLGSLLVNAGKNLINGLINGIKSRIGAVKSTLKGLTGSLTSWKGPESLDKVILSKSGRLVIDGFISGLESRYPKVQSSLGDLTSSLNQSVTVPSGARLTPSSASAGAGSGAASHLTATQQEAAFRRALEGATFRLSTDQRALTLSTRGA